MPKFNATKFKLSDGEAGTTKITFYEAANRTFEIELPTIAIMGFAHTLRLRAKKATVPVAKIGLSSLMRHLRGPHVKTLEMSSRPIGKNGGFDVGVTADFEHIVVAFHAPEGEGAKETSMMLAQDDAAALLKSLLFALETVRQKPTPTTH